MTFFVPTKKASGNEDTDTLINIEKASKIMVPETNQLPDLEKNKGTHCLVLVTPYKNQENMYIYIDSDQKKNAKWK